MPRQSAINGTLFLITELAAYIPYFMLGDTHYNILMISLFLCSVLISTLSLVFHAFINKSERHVYSMDSKLNLIVNNTMKKYKSIAMLLLSGLNAVAWIYVALYTGITGILPASSYYVYIFIQLIAGFGFIVPIYMGLNRKKELLSANTSPIDVDDDETGKPATTIIPTTNIFSLKTACSPATTRLIMLKKARGFSQESPVQ